jgi:transcriptional regulator with XRE-family HTH domain
MATRRSSSAVAKAAAKPAATKTAKKTARKKNAAADIPLGALVRDLRKRMGVTLTELAEATGRSVGFISQIERGLSQPTVLDMNLIAERLGVPGGYFYLAEPPSHSWVTRPGERRTLHYADGFVDHLVSPSMAGRLCVLESQLAPGADTGERALVEHEEQAMYVLEGVVTVWWNGEPCTLKPGDACQLPSGAPTRYANRTDRPARVLWVYC